MKHDFAMYLQRFFTPNTRYAVFSVYVIPMATLMIASILPLTQYNMSMIGNWFDHKFELTAWGIGVSVFLWLQFDYLFRLSAYTDKFSRALLYLSSAFLLFSVLTPYLPDEMPIKALTHFVLAFCSPFLVGLLLLRFLIYLSKCGVVSIRRFGTLLAVATGFSLLLLLRLGFVSSLLEVFVTAAICYILRTLELALMKI